MTTNVALLADTNVLLRLSLPADPQYGSVHRAIQRLETSGVRLYFSAQTISELWNVCTRPIARNGFGLTIAETVDIVRSIEANLEFLPDTNASYKRWRSLVETYEVRGAQVHDARLVALMQSHGVTRILTLNGADFRRYDGIVVVHPAEV